MVDGSNGRVTYSMEPAAELSLCAKHEGSRVVVYTPHMFVQDAASGFVSQRTAEHLIQQPEYPDPVYYLSFLGKYFYRNRALRHLRVEQFRALTGIHKC